MFRSNILHFRWKFYVFEVFYLLKKQKIYADGIHERFVARGNALGNDEAKKQIGYKLFPYRLASWQKLNQFWSTAKSVFWGKILFTELDPVNIKY